MIEVLTRCATKPNTLGKSIVRPERVSRCTDPHRVWYYPPFFHVNSDLKPFDWVAPLATNRIIIHHYMTRDLDHLIQVKYPRRQKWRKPEPLEDYIQMLETKNMSESFTMRRFVPALRKAMGLQSSMVEQQEEGCGCKN